MLASSATLPGITCLIVVGKVHPTRRNRRKVPCDVTEPRIYSSVQRLVTSSAEHRLFSGDCMSLLSGLAAKGPSAKLVVSSPPYNIGKDYEARVPIEEYLSWQHEVIEALSSVVLDSGH